MKPMLIAGLLALASPAAADQALNVALDWTPNTNHVGLYVAKAQGWYADAGLEVELLPYTDTPSSTMVESGVADLGMLTSLGFYTRKAAGADLVALMAVMQHETGRLVFNADRDDIATPADLDGMTYAGFGTGWEDAIVGTMIREAGGQGDYDTVTLGTSAYEALAAGRVDFTMEVAHWEGVNARLEGRKQDGFEYADWGVPDEQGGFLGTRPEWLEQNGQAARDFVAATVRGYAWAADHPQEAADLLIEGADGMLTNPALVEGSMQAILDRNLLRDDQGRVGVIDEERLRGFVRFLLESGNLKDASGEVLSEMPDVSTWYEDLAGPAQP